MLLRPSPRPGSSRSRRVRQALALTLDRPAIIKQLFNGYAILGNDSPWASIYPSTDRSVPQRHQDLALAKKLHGAGRLSEGLQGQTLTLRNTRRSAARPDHRGLGEEDRDRLKLNIMTYTAVLRRHVLGWRDRTRHERRG